MTISRNLILALAVTGGAAIAAMLTARRRAGRLEVVQDKTDLHTWEGEGGKPVRSGGVKPPS